MNCSQAKPLFSPYLDGAISGVQMRELSQHIGTCEDCRENYNLLQQTQRLLSRAGQRKVPADVGLKLRVAISREIARSRAPLFAGMRIRFENTIKAFMLPATAGLALAVAVFVLTMGTFSAPLKAKAANDALLMNTAPEFQQAAFGMSTDSIADDSLVIEAYIDSTGRVDDYRILSDPHGQKDLPTEVKNMLIFTTFHPATFLGRPTTGRAILSFSKISVRG